MSWLTKGLLALVVVVEILALVIGIAASAEALTEFGTYTGNATDPRTISVTFTPDLVWVFAVTDMGNTGQAWIADAAFSTTWSTTAFSAMPCTTCGLRAIGSNSFVVQRTSGGGTGANDSGVTYQWIALTFVDGAIVSGSYSGDGTSNRTIQLGTGWQPDFYLVMGNGSGRIKTRNMDPGGGVFREWSAPNNGTFYGNTCGAGVSETKIAATGFTICSNTSSLNTIGQSYWYMALKENHAQGIWWGSYTGTGVDGYSPAVTSSNPQWVSCWRTNWGGAGTEAYPQWRSAAMAANTSKDIQHNTSPPTQSRTTGLKSYTDASITVGASTAFCNRGDVHDVMILSPSAAAACGPSHPDACYFRVRKP